MHQALDPVIGEWIDLTCRWDEGGLGDYRFVVFDLQVTDSAQVYVQFWARPGGRVDWEVSSGRMNPPADKWLAGDRSRRIEAAGFALSGPGGNYARKIEVRTMADVARTARAVVDVLFDGFDYRGLQPLQVHFACDGRSRPAEVLDALCADDLADVFRSRGFVVTRVAASGSPVLHCAKHGVVTTARLDGATKRKHLYRYARLTTDLKLTPQQAERFGVARADSSSARPQSYHLSTVLEFAGGVTPTWIEQRIAEWDAMLLAEASGPILVKGHRGLVH